VESPDWRREWYSISLDSLRGWGVLLLLLALGFVGYRGYRYWETYSLEREATDVINEDRRLLQQLAGEAGLEAFRAEYEQATTSLGAAATFQSQQQWPEALQDGKRSLVLLQSIQEALGTRGKAGEAQFITAQGGVEYRRGATGEWEQARGRVTLRSGDQVKTASDGSAEIMFVDGTLYTVRPNTLFLVTRSQAGGSGEQAIRMEYGWVNLSTSRNPSAVATPGAQARVGGSSEAAVSYDQDSGKGSFSALSGGLSVITPGGARRELGALQRVVQTGTTLSEPRPLPGAPMLSEPVDNLEANLETNREIPFSWQPVPGASRYAFQVSRSRLFVDNVIDVANRTRTRATLGLRGEGTFLWRVAAFGADGAQGPWSEPRRMRVVSLQGAGGEADRTPPSLDLDDVKSYGSIFIISGRTEPGAAVEVNREAVAVEADGSFIKTIGLSTEGWSFFDVRARDASGNETVTRRRVFVESL
jgi:FecR protein